MTTLVCSYKRALEAVVIGEQKLAKHKLPKARPNDYFAEMVKTDGTDILCTLSSPS